MTVTIVFDYSMDAPHGAWTFENVPPGEWVLRLDENAHPYIESYGKTVVVGVPKESDTGTPRPYQPHEMDTL